MGRRLLPLVLALASCVCPVPAGSEMGPADMAAPDLGPVCVAAFCVADATRPDGAACVPTLCRIQDGGSYCCPPGVEP